MGDKRLIKYNETGPDKWRSLIPAEHMAPQGYASEPRLSERDGNTRDVENCRSRTITKYYQIKNNEV